MKTRTTKRDIINSGKRVISISYYAAQYLLSLAQPVHYYAGVYGWYADIYEFDDVYIVTGYRPFGEKVDHDIVKKYESEAKTTPYENRIDVLERFMKEV